MSQDELLARAALYSRLLSEHALLLAVRRVAEYSPDPNDDEDYQEAFETMKAALRSYDEAVARDERLNA